MRTATITLTRPSFRVDPENGPRGLEHTVLSAAEFLAFPHGLGHLSSYLSTGGTRTEQGHAVANFAAFQQKSGRILGRAHFVGAARGDGGSPGSTRGLDISTKNGILRHWGRRVSVQVLGDFTRDDWNRRDKMSIPRLDISDFADWRNLTKICLASRPLTICGWGSLEHPDFQEAATGQRLSTLGASISEYRAG
jgi:hypothetical protein